MSMIAFPLEPELQGEAEALNASVKAQLSHLILVR